MAEELKTIVGVVVPRGAPSNNALAHIGAGLATCRHNWFNRRCFLVEQTKNASCNVFHVFADEPSGPLNRFLTPCVLVIILAVSRILLLPLLCVDSHVSMHPQTEYCVRVRFLHSSPGARRAHQLFDASLRGSHGAASRGALPEPLNAFSPLTVKE